MTPKLASWLTAAVFCLAQLLWPAAAQAARRQASRRRPLCPCLEPLPEEADPLQIDCDPPAVPRRRGPVRSRLSQDQRLPQ